MAGGGQGGGDRWKVTGKAEGHGGGSDSASGKEGHGVIEDRI